MNAALLLAPDFALILSGFVLKRVLLREEAAWGAMEKLVYYVLFPALLFGSLARANIQFGSAGPVVLSALAGVMLGVALGYLARPLFSMDALAFASGFQCAFRFNSTIGLAVAAKLHGEAGVALMGILIGTMVPVVNVFAVGALARHSRAGLWSGLLRHPHIVAAVAGVAFNAAGLRLPDVLQAYVGRMGEASIALGLLCVGAALRLRELRGGLGASAYLCAVKLAAVPALTWLVARALQLEGTYFASAVLFAALPTATSAYILAVRMGGDGAGVARLVSLSTLAAMVTLPLWALALAAR